MRMRTLAVAAFLLLFLTVSVDGAVYYVDGSASPLQTDDVWDTVEESLPEELRKGLPAEAFREHDAGSFISYLFEKAEALLVPAGRHLGRITVLLVLSALLRTWQGTLSASVAVNEAVSTCITVATALSVLQISVGALASAESAVETVCGIMNTLLPILGALCLAGGEISSAAVRTVEMTSFITVLGNLFSVLLLPLCRVAIAFSAAENLNDCRIRSIGKTVLWAMGAVLGLLMTAFGLFIGAQTAIEASADSARLTGIRFLISQLIPLVGGGISGSASTLAAGLATMKATAGGAGLVLMILLCVPPLLSLLMVRLELGIGKLLAEVLGCDNEKGIFEAAGSVLGFLVASVAVSSVLLCLLLAMASGFRIGG